MALSDYSDIEQEITNAPDPKILPKGSEVRARICSVNSGVSEKNGARWHSIMFDVPEDPLVIPFNDFMWDMVDRDKLEPKWKALAMSQFKSFITAFSIDVSRPFSWEDDLPGKEGWVITGIKSSEDYGDQNSVKKYVAGR
jgi:hypothetical protein